MSAQNDQIRVTRERYRQVHADVHNGGYSRAEPPGFRALMNRLKAFPDGASAQTMRDVGIAYVVLHGLRNPALVGPARASSDFRLLTRIEDDYLFEVVHAGR